MARLYYGGTAADFTIGSATVEDTSSVEHTTATLVSATLSVYADPTGGSPLTDLLSEAGSPMTAVTTDATGRIPRFQGPDAYTAELWIADPGTGDRYRLPPEGLAERIATLEATVADLVDDIANQVVLRNAPTTMTSTLTWDMPNEDIPAIIINQDNTVTVDSSDLVQVNHKGVKAFWLNEWGAPRIFQVASGTLGYSDNPLKIFSRQATDAIQVIRAQTSTLMWRIRDVATGLAQMFGGFSAWEAFTSYSNGYTEYSDSTLYVPRGRLMPGGDWVEWRGRIVCDGSAGAGQTMFTLPTDLRPLRQVQVDAQTNSGSVTQLDINTDGTVVNQRGLSITWMTLDNVVYPIGAN